MCKICAKSGLQISANIPQKVWIKRHEINLSSGTAVIQPSAQDEEFRPEKHAEQHAPRVRLVERGIQIDPD